MSEKQSWFKSWFDSPYYHILYKNRSYVEAATFIDNLVNRFNISQGLTAVDLACGRGRHSQHLVKHGLKVTGLDLSPQSIAFAKEHGGENVDFFVHDMRQAYPVEQQDYIFNFFTSFGYFDDELDNVKVLKTAHDALEPGGKIIIDFLNAHQVIEKLAPEEIKTIDGINFYINKSFEHGYIFKHIRFEDKGIDYAFQERVQAITLPLFKKYLEASGLALLEHYGNYSLETFDSCLSDRLIIVAQKPFA